MNGLLSKSRKIIIEISKRVDIKDRILLWILSKFSMTDFVGDQDQFGVNGISGENYRKPIKRKFLGYQTFIDIENLFLFYLKRKQYMWFS